MEHGEVLLEDGDLERVTRGEVVAGGGQPVQGGAGGCQVDLGGTELVGELPIRSRRSMTAD
ncbi:hypothetical protein AB0M54_46665 [Actinoplanes sp. NPDC051470]|uniref:hypothetical protein n=1 Tax=Actinoplanes sp. NPDC051470 TaxID=3157224 RepID=UPI0034381089